MYSNRPEAESPEYKAWRFGVFSRDGWSCVKCKIKGKAIQAHHIKRWADEPRLRYVVSNGVTLCKDCHGDVTGNESMYEEEFKRVVTQHNLDQKLKGKLSKVKKEAKQNNIFEAMKKWRPRNPHLRF